MAKTESRVDTKLFQATADTVANISRDLQNCLQEWTKIMHSLRGSWQGDASDGFKNISDAVNDNAAVLLGSLRGYKKVLYEMAGIYEKSEKNLSESIKRLKFDKPLR
jgi:WXG100 family type VII secretion target